MRKKFGVEQQKNKEPSAHRALPKPVV